MLAALARRTRPSGPTGGETLAEVGERVRGGLRASSSPRAARAPGPSDGDVVVVSHVSPIKAAVAWALGGDDALAWRLHLSTGSITRIGWGPDGPVLAHLQRGPPGRRPVVRRADALAAAAGGP